MGVRQGRVRNGDFSGVGGSVTSRTRLAGIIICGAMAVSVAISLPLWLSEQSREFPTTPPLSLQQLAVLAQAPTAAVLLALFFIVLGIAALTGWRVAFGACFVLALTIAAPDIQRWQPWYFQYTFMLGSLAFLNERNALPALRMIMAFTYIYSGLQKVNTRFFDNGMTFFLEPFGAFASENLSWLSYVAPFAEFAIGCGLLGFAGRGWLGKVAVVSAIGMHGLLLLALSPLGANFNVVVWPWNAAMAVLAIVLFSRVSEPSSILPVIRRTTYGLIVFVLFAVMPAFGLFGYWPGYLSASLYSSNTADGAVYSGKGSYVDINRLTYDKLNVPAYPSEAVYSNAARDICKEEDVEGPVLAIFSKPNPLTGERQRKLFYCSMLNAG